MVSETGKARRLARMFRACSGRMLCVPLDHGMQVGPITGIADPAPAIDVAVAAGVDAVIVNPGLFLRFSQRFAAGPAVILRLDQTTMWRVGAPTGYPDTHTRLVASVDEAVAMGAEAVITYLFTCNNRPEEETRCFENCAQVAQACRRWGLVHVIEAMGANGGFCEREDSSLVALNCRIAGELGADIIKTDWTGSPESFAPIAAQSVAPVAVAGGAGLSDDDRVVAFAQEAIAAGARGLMFGRNVFQASDPAGLLRRLSDVVHGAV